MKSRTRPRASSGSRSRLDSRSEPGLRPPHLEPNLRQEILDSIHAHIAVIDGAGVILATNAAWERFARENGGGASGRTGVGTNYLEICRRSMAQSEVSGDARQAHRGIWAVLRRRRASFTYEYGCPSAGRPRWFLMTVTPLGKGRGAVVAHTEITERRRAESASEDSRTKLQAALDSMKDAVFIYDQGGGVVDFNEAFATFHRFRSKAECSRKLPDYHRILEVFTPGGDLLPLDKWAVPRALSGETQSDAKYTLRRRDTGQVWLATYHAAPIRDRQGRIVGSVVVSRDITGLEREEKALQESEERYRSLVEASPDAILILKGGRIEFANRAGQRMLHASSSEQVKGRSLFDFFRPNRREYIQQRTGGLTEISGVSPLIEEELVRPDGTTRWVTLASAMFTDNGEDAVQFILRDITEERRLESEILEITDHEQQRIGHDLHDGLGQQLTGLEMKTYGLMEDLAAENLNARRHKLEEQARELNEALRDCITFTRSISRGLAPVILRTEGLAGALGQMVRGVRTRGRMECRFICREVVRLDDPQVATHLYRIAQEALNNAVKHAKPSRILVRLSQSQGLLRLQVQDNGRGMPRKRGSGAGIGLEVMRHRAHVIGASLSIQSRPGEGVTVRCTLPIVNS